MDSPTELTPPPLRRGDYQGEITITSLRVNGALPTGLSGRLLGVGPDGLVHSVHLQAGRSVSYRSRWVMTDSVAQRLGVESTPGPRHTGPDIVAGNIVAFDGSILAIGDRSLAYKINGDGDTVCRVDLAGQLRGLAAFPKRDPVSGDLHLLAFTVDGAPSHVVIFAGARTRTIRTLDGAPTPITDLAVTCDHVLFAAGGFVGYAPRRGEAHIAWFPTGLEALLLVHAHDAGETVVLYTLTPALERWTLRARATIDRKVLDATPRRFARTSDERVNGPPRFLWSTGNGTAAKLDLDSLIHVRHAFRQGEPGDFVLVADSARPGVADSGWMVGFLHGQASETTNLVVLDAADLASVASIPMPRHIPAGVHCTWIPTTHRESTTENSPQRESRL